MQTGIGDNVLHRFSGVILVVGPILVMMVRIFRPMQRGVRQILHLSERPSRCRDGHGLPQQSEKEEDGGDPAMHGRKCIGSEGHRSGSRLFAGRQMVLTFKRASNSRRQSATFADRLLTFTAKPPNAPDGPVALIGRPWTNDRRQLR